jgi:tetratricopeptide (TPR) repeat protein
MRAVYGLFFASLAFGLTGHLAFAQQTGAGSPDSRVALVIGNASYPNADPKLTQPAANARVMGDELFRDGFQVEEGENLTKEDMQRAIGRLYDKIKSGTAALLFFSGYGIQASGKSYMVPIDAQIYKEDDVRHDGISVDAVLSEMKNRGASVKIVILDASRRNRYESNFRSAPLGLAVPATPPVGTLLMYSAGPGTVARDSAGDLSLFVSELLDEMRAPGVSAAEVFDRTRMGVLRASQGEQQPWNLSYINEAFSFGPTAVAARPPVQTPEKPVPANPPPDGEQRAYERALQTGTRQSFEDFLNRYSSGQYADNARRQLAKLDSAPANSPQSQPPPTTPPARTPASVKDREAIKNLGTYIAKNPDDAAAYYRRGQLYAKIGEFARSITDFDEALRLNPKDAEALNNRCWARAMVGEFRTALADCNEALQLRPEYADALDSRGFVELKIGELSKAIADYDKALRFNKKQASSLYGRGLAKKRTGDPAGGASDIAAAEAIDPAVAAEFERSGLY